MVRVSRFIPNIQYERGQPGMELRLILISRKTRAVGEVQVGAWIHAHMCLANCSRVLSMAHSLQALIRSLVLLAELVS